MWEHEGPPEPWRSFFNELDAMLGEPIHVHCFGGFVLIHAYGVARTTNDVDFANGPRPFSGRSPNSPAKDPRFTQNTRCIWIR